MYRFRHFDNRDVPFLARIWSRQPPQRALVQPMTPALLEQFVLSKVHFDPQGLIVVTQHGDPMAFVHAGFGPAETPHQLDTSLGVTHRVMVDPTLTGGTAATELLARSEEYLISRGAKVLYGGGIRPLDAFYHGLYGGSESPGILESDPQMQQLLLNAGYRVIDRVIVLQCNLSQFRAPVTWASRQWNRCTHLGTASECEASSWWRKRTTSSLDAQRLELRHSDRRLLATTTLWDLEPLAKSWGVRAVGIMELQVAESMRRRGIATHLLSEVLRQLRLQGVSLVEVQTMIQNEAALDMYRKLGFVQKDCGSVFRKDSL